jgi:hypothetical protein
MIVADIDNNLASVDDKVKAIDERVTVVIHGAQTMPGHSLNKNRP